MQGRGRIGCHLGVRESMPCVPPIPSSLKENPLIKMRIRIGVVWMRVIIGIAIGIWMGIGKEIGKGSGIMQRSARVSKKFQSRQFLLSIKSGKSIWKYLGFHEVIELNICGRGSNKPCLFERLV